jgi:hypothetical protein
MGRLRGQVAEQSPRAWLLPAPSRTLRRNFTNLDKCFIFLCHCGKSFSASDAITLAITAKLKTAHGRLYSRCD